MQNWGSPILSEDTKLAVTVALSLGIPVNFLAEVTRKSISTVYMKWPEPEAWVAEHPEFISWLRAIFDMSRALSLTIPLTWTCKVAIRKSFNLWEKKPSSLHQYTKMGLLEISHKMNLKCICSAYCTIWVANRICAQIELPPPLRNRSTFQSRKHRFICILFTHGIEKDNISRESPDRFRHSQ